MREPRAGQNERQNQSSDLRAAPTSLTDCAQLSAFLPSPFNQVVGERAQSPLRGLRRVAPSEKGARRHPELIVIGHRDLGELGLKGLKHLTDFSFGKGLLPLVGSLQIVVNAGQYAKGRSITQHRFLAEVSRSQLVVHDRTKRRE